MPSRSSRSSPASLTSLREPTGSASRAIAIRVVRLTVPGVGLADTAEALPGLLAAERARDAGLVGGARGEPQRGGCLVVPGEVGVEHRWVVGRDRALDAGGDELRQRMVFEPGHGAGAEGRERADVEHRAAARELSDEAAVLDGADPVPEPVGLQVLECA